MDKLKLVSICCLVLAVGGCGKNAPTESKEERAARVCAARLNSFATAKRRWALDNNAASTATPTLDDLATYFRRGMHQCPEGGTYTIGTVGEPPQCSIAAHNEYFKTHPPPDGTLN